MDHCDFDYTRCCGVQPALDCHQPTRIPRRQRHRVVTKSALVLFLVAAALPTTIAGTCISLQGSIACPAFASASINTNLTGDFPFLSFVSDVTTFDTRLREYVTSDYARKQYQQRIGCSSVNLSNTTNIYARYTTSVLCNSIIQNSDTCNASTDNSRPLCADSCAQYAVSEQEIASSPELCGTAGPNAVDIIRSDFTTCALPARALSGNCIDAAVNEGAECGYQSNLQGLCSYCGSSSPNATDSCCISANVESRCTDVHLPTTTSMAPLFPSSTSSAAPTGTSATGTSAGLSGGSIAGIVVGSLLGAALILALVIFFCMQMRKRKHSQNGSILNTPSPTRANIPGPPMSYGGDDRLPSMILPGARVARMSALEGSSSSEHQSHRAGDDLAVYRNTRNDTYESPESGRSHLGGALPKRDGSLSSQSVLAITDGYSSPRSGTNTDRNFSSPEGVASGQSEQLQFFKDYYSQDDIHPNDTVATLWAYQPRANDEFELERGDMLKIVGIWDDGWATGVKLSESTEQWEARKALQRDSGVSNGSRRSKLGGESDIKAFPLVCVCLPQHWRKTIEGDSTDTGLGSGGDRQPPSP